ncbi:ABC transporter permease [Gracilibacillus kekensis]|uniref:ABC-2 type transport system permease protein n=1 Tax=Gracilibacillus kekensis TaxID=1027249 RepID=A0A1M7PZJ8_9BACI|nr:ABC transporter permease [Gracilibacillus kekensis]SHN23091.1 ABC-2 type transport system permease protein [Gracilibacillus kekensis]
MHSLKHIVLFTKSNLIQLRRKWLSLPLLLLSPILLIGLLILTVISMLDVTNQKTIEVGLVDLDQSEETEIIVKLLEESSQLGNYFTMEKVEEEQAIKAIENNQISSYIIFPDDFFQNLMDGERSQLSIIGNPKQPIESQLINELIETVTRHIRGSQANILTINHYAKQLNMDSEERNKLLFEQFTDYFFYVLGGDQVIQEDQVTNNATSSTILYFSIAGWFTLVTIWIFIIYTMLHKDNNLRMRQRMRLYGVTDLQQAIATGIVTLLITAILAVLSFSLIPYFFNEVIITGENYIRLSQLLLFHGIIFLQCIILIDWLISSKKLTVLIQTLFTGIIILFSGAIIPKIYYPIYLEEFFLMSFSHQSFYWMEQIILNGRFYAELQPLIFTTIIGGVLLVIVSFGKERVFK